MDEMIADTSAQMTSSKSIMALADEAQALIGQLQGDVDATSAIWKGNAHTAFLGGSSDIHAQLQKGQAAMQDVSGKMKGSSAGYEGTEGDSASALRAAPSSSPL